MKLYEFGINVCYNEMYNLDLFVGVDILIMVYMC